jgi:hypothetical protein
VRILCTVIYSHRWESSKLVYYSSLAPYTRHPHQERVAHADNHVVCVWHTMWCVGVAHHVVWVWHTTWCGCVAHHVVWVWHAMWCVCVAHHVVWVWHTMWCVGVAHHVVWVWHTMWCVGVAHHVVWVARGERVVNGIVWCNRCMWRNCLLLLPFWVVLILVILVLATALTPCESNVQLT